MTNQSAARVVSAPRPAPAASQSAISPAASVRAGRPRMRQIYGRRLGEVRVGAHPFGAFARSPTEYRASRHRTSGHGVFGGGRILPEGPKKPNDQGGLR